MKGQLARLTRSPINRGYHSSIPAGTLFIILGVIDLPGYDLWGYYLFPPMPHMIRGLPYYTAYIERGGWELIGTIEDNVELLTETAQILQLQFDSNKKD